MLLHLQRFTRPRGADWRRMASRTLAALLLTLASASAVRLPFSPRSAPARSSPPAKEVASGKQLGDFVTAVVASSISTTATVVRAFRNESLSDDTADKDVELVVDGTVAAIKTVAGASILTNFAVATAKSAAAVAGAAFVGPAFKLAAATGAALALGANASSAAADDSTTAEDRLLWVRASYLVARDSLRKRAAERAVPPAPEVQLVEASLGTADPTAAEEASAALGAKVAKADAIAEDASATMTSPMAASGDDTAASPTEDVTMTSPMAASGCGSGDDTAASSTDSRAPAMPIFDRAIFDQYEEPERPLLTEIAPTKTSDPVPNSIPVAGLPTVNASTPVYRSLQSKFREQATQRPAVGATPGRAKPDVGTATPLKQGLYASGSIKPATRSEPAQPPGKRGGALSQLDRLPASAEQLECKERRHPLPMLVVIGLSPLRFVVQRLSQLIARVRRWSWGHRMRRLVLGATRAQESLEAR